MKYAIVLPDGASDEPLEQLGGKTPLQAARIPNMDAVAQQGRLGTVVTIPAGYTAGTDVGTLTLMGYDAQRSYSGRAPIEAAARRLTASDDQLIFRCNFVTIADGRMKDFTAGHIAQADADALIASLNELDYGAERCAFHPGVSYRNLLLLSNATDMALKCVGPHDIADQPVEAWWPKGKGQERVAGIMQRAAAMLAEHPVNVRRREAGESWATNIWLWGQGRPVQLQSLQERFGLRGAVITAVDIIRGIAVGMGMDLIEVPGATGYIDTNYEGKGQAAVEALRDYDVVVVHVEAPDEAAHQGLAHEKVRALERIDEAVLGPLLQALRGYGDYRVLIAPDHATPVSTKAHSPVPPPYAMMGTGIAERSGRCFTEQDAAAQGPALEPGHQLIAQFFR
jgi:2,3-bisphosphoglycerate-independent phosphoglycerate mutase